MLASRPKLALWVIAGLTTTAIAFGVATRQSHSDSDLTAIDGSDSVAISASSIAPGQIRFFVYHARSGSDIRLIIARDAYGNLQAVLDACERCYMYHRGYEATHGIITCRWCGTHYKVGAMREGMSGCVPVKLPFQTVGQTIRIGTAELERQSRLF